MRNDQNPWRWPLSIGAATAVLWVMIFLVPPQWFAFLLAIQEKKIDDRATRNETWLVLQPPPEFTVDPELESKKLSKPLIKDLEPFEPHHWWNASRGVSIIAKSSPEASRISHQDSVTYFFNSLGLADDFMLSSRPDSLLASKIFFLQLEDSFDFSAAKPYLSALGRAEDYADIMSRAAAMYDEFLNTTIMVPD